MKMNCNDSLRHYVGTPQGDARRGSLDHSMHKEVPDCLSTTPHLLLGCEQRGGRTTLSLQKLQRPRYLSRVDHERKIRSKRQRTDTGK